MGPTETKNRLENDMEIPEEYRRWCSLLTGSTRAVKQTHRLFDKSI
jgi:hypothetical protein